MYEMEKKSLERQYIQLQNLQREVNDEREKVYSQLEQIEKLGIKRDELKNYRIGTAVQIALDAVVVSLMFYMLPTFMRVTPTVGTMMRDAYIAGYGALTALGIKDTVMAHWEYKKLATPEILALEKNSDKLEKEQESLLNKKINLELSQGKIEDEIHIIEMKEEMGLKDPGELNIQMPELDDTTLEELSRETLYSEFSNEEYRGYSVNQPESNKTYEKKLSKVY